MAKGLVPALWEPAIRTLEEVPVNPIPERLLTQSATADRPLPASRGNLRLSSEGSEPSYSRSKYLFSFRINDQNHRQNI